MKLGQQSCRWLIKITNMAFIGWKKNFRKKSPLPISNQCYLKTPEKHMDYFSKSVSLSVKAVERNKVINNEKKNNEKLITNGYIVRQWSENTIIIDLKTQQTVIRFIMGKYWLHNFVIFLFLNSYLKLRADHHVGEEKLTFH